MAQSRERTHIPWQARAVVRGSVVTLAEVFLLHTWLVHVVACILALGLAAMQEGEIVYSAMNPMRRIVFAR